MRRSRRLVLAAAALGLGLAATGCTYMSPVQTHEFYQAGDGTNANLEREGALYAGMRNAVLIFAEDGTAEFSGTAVNYSDEPVTLDLEGLAEGSSVFTAQIEVPAQSTVEIGPEQGQEQVEVGTVDVLPGTILDLTVTAGDQETTISIPSLETTFTHFEREQSAQG